MVRGIHEVFIILLYLFYHNFLIYEAIRHDLDYHVILKWL